METISNYLDSLFMNVPLNRETQKAKADLLETMEDHFHELLAEGKNENEAIGLVISEFGSIDELLEELEVEPPAKPRFSFGKRKPSGMPLLLSEMERYWRMVRGYALKVSSGIFLCCAGVGLMIFFASNYMEGLALSCFFVLMAAAVGLFITGGMTFSKETKKIQYRPVPLDVQQEAADYVKGYSKSFSVSLVLGICLCIVSFVPIFLFSNGYSDAIGVGLFLGIVGLGAFLIVYGSIIYTYYKKFAE